MANRVFIRKFGKYDLYKQGEEFMLTDSWLCDWFILYPQAIGGGWAHDGRFALRKDIRAWFNKVSPKVTQA
jgi:hypothetical protein